MTPFTHGSVQRRDSFPESPRITVEAPVRRWKPSPVSFLGGFPRGERHASSDLGAGEDGIKFLKCGGKIKVSRVERIVAIFIASTIHRLVYRQMH